MVDASTPHLPSSLSKTMPSAKDYGLTSPKYATTNESMLVKTGVGRLRGILVTASKMGGTIELMDNTSNAIPVLVREFSTDTTVPKYYKFGDVTFGTGLYIVIGGVMFCTIIYF